MPRHRRRRGATLETISPDEVLEVDDLLLFAVAAAGVRFIRNTPGLVPLVDSQSRKLKDTLVSGALMFCRGRYLGGLGPVHGVPLVGSQSRKLKGTLVRPAPSDGRGSGTLTMLCTLPRWGCSTGSNPTAPPWLRLTSQTRATLPPAACR